MSEGKEDALQPGTFDLHVWVMGARNLASSHADPYVVVSLLRHQTEEALRGCSFKTSTLKNTSRPEWRESFVFSSIPEGHGDFDLELALFDWNRLGKDDFMGRIVIPSIGAVLKHAKADSQGRRIIAKNPPLVTRPTLDGFGVEPEEDKLQGELHYVLSPHVVELTDLSEEQLHPPDGSRGSIVADFVYARSPHSSFKGGASSLGSTSTGSGDSGSANNSVDSRRGSNASNGGAPSSRSTPSPHRALTLGGPLPGGEHHSRQGSQSVIDGAGGDEPGGGSGASASGSNTPGGGLFTKPYRAHTLTRDKLRSRLESNSTLKTTAKQEEIEKAQKEAEEEEKERQKVFTPEEEAKRTEKRHKVRDELISTERTYVQAILLLNDHFVKKLKKENPENVGADSMQIQAMVSNIETIAAFQQQFLEDLGGSEFVADVILKYADYFKIYTAYMNGYEKSITTINALRTNKKFQTFMQHYKEDVKRAGGMEDLMSYMIMPVQRIPRYVLLLKELVKNTHPNDASYNALKNALLKVESIASHINEMKRQVENMSKLIEIQERISGEFPTLIAPHRKFLREGEVTAIQQKGLLGSLQKKPLIFFLFSDVLLWTNPSFKFKGALNLASASISDAKFRQQKAVFGFDISTSKTNLAVTFKDQAEKESWEQTLTQVISELQDVRNMQRQRKRVVKDRQRDPANKQSQNIHGVITQGLRGLVTDGEEEIGKQDTLRGGAVLVNPYEDESDDISAHEESQSRNSSALTPVISHGSIADGEHKGGGGGGEEGEPGTPAHSAASNQAASAVGSHTLDALAALAHKYDKHVEGEGGGGGGAHRPQSPGQPGYKIRQVVRRDKTLRREESLNHQP